MTEQRGEIKQVQQVAGLPFEARKFIAGVVSVTREMPEAGEWQRVAAPV